MSFKRRRMTAINDPTESNGSGLTLSGPPPKVMSQDPRQAMKTAWIRLPKRTMTICLRINPHIPILDWEGLVPNLITRRWMRPSELRG